MTKGLATAKEHGGFKMDLGRAKEDAKNV